jgi:uncharacterized protein YjdB
MTFKHKLSHRLALMRDLLLAGTVALLACEIPSRASLEEASKVVISPDTLVVASNQTTDLVAVALTATGDTASSGITWTATAGTVTDTTIRNGVHRGHYRAPGTPGKYKVQARASSGSAADSATVTVTSVAVASLTVSPATATITIGAARQFTAVASDSAGNPLTGRVITWSNNNPAVASLGISGLTIGVSAGTATIGATSEGQTATATVTVIPVPVAAVTISPSSATIVVGSTSQLTAVTKDSAGNTLSGRVVSWASGNTAVATVNGSGLVSAVGVGSATVTATSEGTSSSASITVTNVPVASVTVSPTSASITAGATQQLSAATKDAAGNTLTGRVVTWASSNTAVAMVNGAGLVTGVASGSTTITATSEGKSGTSAITVSTVPVASVSVSPASANLTTGQTVQLTATPRDAGGNALSGRAVTWASGNTSVATVNGNGLVTGVSAGSVTITATSEGKSGTSSITVTVAPVATVSVSPASTSVAVGGSVQLAVTLRDASGNVLSGRVVTWSSNATGVATVNVNGLVTALLVGSATITATSEGQSGTSAITVSAAPPPSTTWPNEPAGFTVYSEQDFSSTFGGTGDFDLGNGWRRYDWHSPVLVTRVSDGTAPMSTGYVAQFSYPAGFNAGTEPGNIYRTLGNPSRYFAGFWWKGSNPWQPNAAGDKICFLHVSGGTFFLLMKDGVITAQNLYVDTNYPNNGAHTPLTLGAWHRFEILVDRSGGILKIWIDGALNLSYTGVNYNTFDQFELAPTWGGAVGTKSENDFFWYSGVHLSK